MVTIKNLLRNNTNSPQKSGLVLVVFRLLSSLLQFPAIILLTKSWSREQMGVWLLINSFSQVILVIADFGLGQSLRLAFAKSKELTKNGELLANSALSFSVILSIILLGIFLLILLVLNPLNLFTITDQVFRNQLNLIFALFIGCTIISAPSLIIVQLSFAFHEPQKTVIYDLMRTIILFSASMYAKMDNFLFIVCIVAIFSLITRIFQYINFFSIRNWRFRYIEFKQAFKIVQPYFVKSIEFWILAIIASIQVSLLPWLIAQVVSVSELGKVAILIQILGFLLTLHLAFYTPIQSVYSNANFLMASSYIKKSLISTIIVSPIAFILIFLLLPLITHLTGKHVIFDLNILLFFAFWGFLWLLINTSSIMLNGIGEIRIQILGLALCASIPYLSIIFGWVTNLFSLFQIIILGLLCLFTINMVFIKQSLISLKTDESNKKVAI